MADRDPNSAKPVQRRWMRRGLLLIGSAIVAVLLAELLLAVATDVPVRGFFTVYDPVVGKRYKPGYSGWVIYPEYEAFMRINSRGFRGPEPPPSMDGCVLFLGDSFTEGQGVNDGEEFPALVRKALDERHGSHTVPVVNAGMADTGNGRWIHLLENELAGARPRLVVLEVFTNDIPDNVREGLFRLDDDGLLQPLPAPPPPLSRRLQPWIEWIPGIEYSRLLALTRMLSHQARRGHQSPGGDGAAGTTSAGDESVTAGKPGQLFVALVERALQICRDRGWPTALMALDFKGAGLDRLRELALRYEAPFLPIRNRDAHPEYYFPVDGHWTAEGHRFAADLILDKLLAPDSRYLRDVR